MKKILIPALILVGLSACRKDRTCTCVDSSGAEIYKQTYARAKKSEGQTYCQALQSTYSSGSGITCTLK